MKEAKAAYQELQTVTQRSDQQGGAQKGMSPTGASPTLYKVNPDKSITPATSGYTSSSHQLTTSGK